MGCFHWDFSWQGTAPTKNTKSLIEKGLANLFFEGLRTKSADVFGTLGQRTDTSPDFKWRYQVSHPQFHCQRARSKVFWGACIKAIRFPHQRELAGRQADKKKQQKKKTIPAENNALSTGFPSRTSTADSKPFQRRWLPTWKRLVCSRSIRYVEVNIVWRNIAYRKFVVL